MLRGTPCAGARRQPGKKSDARPCRAGARNGGDDWWRCVRNCLTIDGSQGEGGGQILRTTLALSLVTGRPSVSTASAPAASKPGLLRQHLTAVQAAATGERGDGRGGDLGSGTLTFHAGSRAWRRSLDGHRYGRQRHAGAAGDPSRAAAGARGVARGARGRDTQPVRAAVRFPRPHVAAGDSPDGWKGDGTPRDGMASIPQGVAASRWTSNRWRASNR